MKWTLCLAGLGVVALSRVFAAEPVDFDKQIKPILELSCLKCHGPEKPKGKLNLETKADALKGGNNGPALVPGKPSESPIYTTTILPEDHDDLMPPAKEGKLPSTQTDLLKAWIEQGAHWPDGPKLVAVKKADFVKEIQPLLEFNCVACHREGYVKGGLRLDVKDLAFKGGDGGPGVVPGKPKESSVYTSTTLSAEDDGLMPPANKGGPMPKDEIELLRLWIEQGAFWPDGLVLTQKKKEEAPGANEPLTVAEIHKMILARLDAKTEAEMRSYTNTIPGSEVGYAMVPIPSGEFVMGSPANEPGRGADEGPQRKVTISPFWMGQREVTWDEYNLFMYPDEERKFKDQFPTDPAVDKVSDAIARPTKPYVEMSFGMGKDGYPAISMTHHAANKFCEWLSAKTGHYYRLPTEAEWEYACRAGTNTRFSWGDDEKLAGQYAWFEKNSDFKYQKVGRKKPNAWGLFDMHGNVAEWCLDGYEPSYDPILNATNDPWLVGTKPYPHVARGGSWDDSLANLRSAARRASDKSWKQQDPQLPKSIWYLTDAQFLGFRIVRPLKVPEPEGLLKVWNNGVERE